MKEPNIPVFRKELYFQLTRCWKDGVIAIQGRDISDAVFISECDQLAQRLDVDLDLLSVNGKIYAMANEGLPLKIGKKHPYRELHKNINADYRLNQIVWKRLQGMQRSI